MWFWNLLANAISSGCFDLHLVPTRYTLRLHRDDYPDKLRCGHVLFRHSRDQFDYVRQLSRWIVLSSSIISTSCVPSRHLQRYRLLEPCMLGLLGGQVLLAWIAE